MTPASSIWKRITEEHGDAVPFTGGAVQHLPPSPERMLAIDAVRGLPEIKTERLRAVSCAALDGVLQARALYALAPAEALSQLQAIPGIGPFSAELLLLRGAGSPDVFPENEPRLRRAMMTACAVDESADIARIAESWNPVRSWLAVLFRTWFDRRDV